MNKAKIEENFKQILTQIKNNKQLSNKNKRDLLLNFYNKRMNRVKRKSGKRDEKSEDLLTPTRIQ